MAELLVCELDESVVERLRQLAAEHGHSLQEELQDAIEAYVRRASKAEARALAAQIRAQLGVCRQTESGLLQADDRLR